MPWRTLPLVSVREAGHIGAVSAEARDEILSLRSAGVPPKMIARRLGIAPHLVAETIWAAAAAQPRPAPAEPRCWVNAGWSHSVEAPRDRGWEDATPAGSDVHGTGLVQVAVAAPHRDRRKVTFCGYLLDVNCLGVKDALGPRSMEKESLEDFIELYFSGWDTPPVPAPFDLARELVFGAASFAAGLGFSPHADFRRAAGVLGSPPREISIAFGSQGRPFYISGPFDDPDAVLRTLEKTVGAENFDFVIGYPDQSWSWDG